MPAPSKRDKQSVKRGAHNQGRQDPPSQPLQETSTGPSRPGTRRGPGSSGTSPRGRTTRPRPRASSTRTGPPARSAASTRRSPPTGASKNRPRTARGRPLGTIQGRIRQDVRPDTRRSLRQDPRLRRGARQLQRRAHRRGPRGNLVRSALQFTADEIRARIDGAHDTMVANARAVQDEFVWREIASPEQLGEVRMAAMQRFLADFPRGSRRDDTGPRPSLTSTFVTASSTSLSARPSCSPTPSSSLRFPRRRHRGDVPGRDRGARLPAAQELRRNLTAPETRGRRLARRQYTVEIRKVTYEFQRGGDKMLVVGKPNPEQAC